jgi:hypothetical protein
VLAIPAVPIEEDEVHALRFLGLLFDPEDTLDRGAFPTQLAGIFFNDPDRPFSTF